ncbi:MAG: hypothetical protein QM778_21130 [Myxococcales bacterium]
MSPGPGARRRVGWGIALVLGLVLLGFLAFKSSGRHRALPAPETLAAPEPTDAAAPTRGSAPPARPASRADDAGCRPGALMRCHQGDVWSASSCDELEERVEECGDHLCREGSCETPAETPCQEPAEGRCDGQTVVLCQAGRTQRVDCAAKGMSCAIGEEGAQCVPFIPAEMRCKGAARCEKDTLVTCREGRVERVECGDLRAQCLSLPGAREPSCLRVEPPPLAGCGPCGCAETGAGEGECDGRDEDSDGKLDEGLDCGPVPIVAFVATNEKGESSYAREDLDAEIARVNRAFAGSEEETTLTFELDQVIENRGLALAGRAGQGDLSAGGGRAPASTARRILYPVALHRPGLGGRRDPQVRPVDAAQWDLRRHAAAGGSRGGHGGGGQGARTHHSGP